jgi:CheY-like chemotaxis protein
MKIDLRKISTRPQNWTKNAAVMAHILLVDDEAPLLEAQSEFLRRSGHTVRTAANGDEAIDLVARDDFDLVITDINMPGKEGLETIAALRRMAPNTKIIATSGGTVAIGARDNLSMAQIFGAAFTLPKPVSGEALIAAVARVLSP